MPSSIPRGGSRKYCKVCFENTGKTFWMDNLGDRIKCSNCGREVQISGGQPLSRPLRSADPVRFRTGGFGIGSAGGSTTSARDRETPAFKPTKKRGVKPKSPEEFPMPEIGKDDVFENDETYQISGEFHRHTIDDIRCEIINGVLEIESRLVDFFKRFPLPEDIISSSLRASLKNAILDIHLKRKQIRKGGKDGEN